MRPGDCSQSVIQVQGEGGSPQQGGREGIPGEGGMMRGRGNASWLCEVVSLPWGTRDAVTVDDTEEGLVRGG